MTQLVVFRAIQGVGAGGLFPLSLAVIGAIVPPRDRGRYQGLIGAVFAAASIAGPAVGGFIVDNTTWRWVFLVNLPVGGLALAVISLDDAATRGPDAEHSIDWLGAGVLAAGTASLLLGLVWGSDYGWRSGRVVRRARPRGGAARGASRSSERRRARADPAVRRPAEPDRRVVDRVRGARRDGDVRDDLVRPALRAGRDRDVGDVVRRRAHAADARRRDDVGRHGAARVADRALPLERRSSGRSC